MRHWKLSLWSVVLLFVAGVLDGAVAHRLAIAGAPPDFPLVVVCSCGLLLGRAPGTVMGFVAGLLLGALSGASMGGAVVSRMLAGFLAGWSPRLLSPRVWLTGPAVTFACTVTAGLTFLLIAPQSDLAGWVQLTLVRSTYNGVLALPVYLLLLRSKTTALES